MNKGIVLSDVDGTLLKGSLVLDHACYLHDEKIVDLEDLPSQWKASPKNEVLISELAEAYRESIIGKTSEDLHVKDYVRSTVDSSHLFYSSMQRLKTLKKSGFEVVLISGSPSFLLTPFARNFRFKSKGSLYERDGNQRFTGQVKTPMFGADSKRSHVKTLKVSNYPRIIAYGDTASDVPLFEVAHESYLVAPSELTLSKVTTVKNILSS